MMIWWRQNGVFGRPNGGVTVAEYYKFEIANWDEGTAMLTLEQEAAYLRVVNAIRLKDQPLTFNSRMMTYRKFETDDRYRVQA